MDEPHIENMNRKQESTIEKLQEVLNFLKNEELSEESLECIDKPLDNLLSSLKYIPSKPSFNQLPTEIKTDILDYLCGAGAIFAASVCKEWSDIVKRSSENIREASLLEVTIGKHCTNMYKCEDNKCFMPSHMLKALTDLKLDVSVCLRLCHPLTDVDSTLVVEGLTSASSLELERMCWCSGFEELILTNDQLKLLFDALENKEIMDSIKLRFLDLTHLDQDRLVNFLVNKTRSLSLDEGLHGTLLDVRKLVGQMKNSTDSKLTVLVLHQLDYPDDLSKDMADALCNVESVVLREGFLLKTETAQRLQENILNRSVVIRYLCIYEDMDWRSRICCECLKLLLNKMISVVLLGSFTTEQQEAAKSCPGVNVGPNRIEK